MIVRLQAAVARISQAASENSDFAGQLRERAADDLRAVEEALRLTIPQRCFACGERDHPERPCTSIELRQSRALGKLRANFGNYYTKV